MMPTFICKTKGNSPPEHKARVYFTCHPDDFSMHFEKICEDIFKTHDCAIYYTENMAEEIEEKYKESDLGRMNLFVIPVTFKLLSQPNRAMDSDFPYAKEKKIPVLPIILEPDLDAIYAREDKFGELQYINPYAHDRTAISYEEKLKKYLDSVLISNEMAERIRQAFGAYIFLSYRKKDRHYANELMKIIHSDPKFRDIAIWYDEFLTPGESFRENIEKMMEKSQLFTLLVTPNLLEYVNGKPNYVMAYEYPHAKEAGMDILPAEVEETDKGQLHSKYIGIPDCVSPRENEIFRKKLASVLLRSTTAMNHDNPEHDFLIGLAYLEGIDMETDRDRGITLITSAAEANLVVAMEKLLHIYKDCVDMQYGSERFIYWSQKLADYYFEECFSLAAQTYQSNRIQELFSRYDDPYWYDVIKIFLLKVDSHVDRSKIKEFYDILKSFNIQEYTLLFDAIQNMVNHREYSQLILVEEILQRTMDKTYLPYGHLFWYVPEYNLYEIAIQAAWNMRKNAGVVALVRDVCFIFGQYDYITDITTEIDGVELYNEVRSQLGGVRRGLCELFYVGHTDFDGGTTIYPRCFNLSEAKQMAFSGMGVSGRMDTLFEDELGLFTVTKESSSYFGIVIVPYDDHVEKFLSGDMRFVRGIIFLDTSNTFFDYIEFYRSNIKVMYIPENCTTYSSYFTQHLNLSLFIRVHPEKGACFQDDGTIGIKTFASYAHMYIRKHVKPGGNCTGIQPHFFQNFTELTTIDYPREILREVIDIYSEYGESYPFFGDDEKLCLGESCFQNCIGLTSVVLPANIQEINSKAFRNCKKLKQITFPRELTRIGASAFYECINLQSVFLENKVVIENYAFFKCKNLSEVHFKKGVSMIGMGAFTECAALHHVEFSQGIRLIESYAFSGSGLKALRFPSQTGYIISDKLCEYRDMFKLRFGQEAFSNCHCLEEVILPDDLTTIPAGCFLGCDVLASLHLPEQLEIIGSWAFEKCGSLSSVSFNSLLKEIGCYAFKDCNLISVELPPNVQLIDDYAFLNNVSLERIKITNPKVKVGRSVFSGCNQVKYAELPEILRGVELGLPSDCEILWLSSDGMNECDSLSIRGLLAIPAGAYYRRTHLKHLIIHDAVRIDEFAFWGCSLLENVSVSSTLTVIGDWAFAHCVNLSHVPFLAQIEVLSAGAFENCVRLTEAILNSNIKIIEGWTFAGCTQLTHVRFPPGLRRIDSGAFEKCFCLRSPESFENLVEIGDNAFEECARIKSIKLPVVEAIGAYAFDSCHSLESIDLGEKLEYLGEGAFNSCTKLKAIHMNRSALDLIPDQTFCDCINLQEVYCSEMLEAIGEKAFFNCKNLKHITLPEDTLQDIHEGAFALCENLTSIRIPGVRWLPTGVFFGCAKLTTVQLSPHIWKIGEGVFALCSSLQSIRLGNELQEIGYKAFSDCSSLKAVHIPLSVKTIGDGAFENCKSLNRIEISRNFQGDLERIFGQIDTRIVTFIDTSDSVHFVSKKTDEASTVSEKSSSPNQETTTDLKLTEAITLLFEKNYLTTALLQRHLSIPYSQALKIMETFQTKKIMGYDTRQMKYVPLTSKELALQILFGE